MKRVLMYDPYHDCAFGAQRAMIMLAEGIRERGFEPIIATGKEGQLTRMAREAGLRVEVIPIPDTLDIFGGAALAASAPRKVLISFSLLMYAMRVLRHAKRLGADILYANELRSVFFLAPSKLLLRKRLFWTIHGGNSFRGLSALGAWAADEMMMVSKAAAKALPPRARERARSLSKLSVNYAGIDASGYAPAPSEEARREIRRGFGLPEEGLLIATAGSICHRKGYDTLLAALERVVDEAPGVHLAVAGDLARETDAEYMAGLRREVEEKRLPVTFLGWRDDLPALLSASDIFVLASREEGLGIVTLEAMATHLPVIVTYAGGSEETVVDGESGLIVQPDDPEALAGRLRMLLGDAGLRARLGARARERCLEVFAQTRYKERFAALLRGEKE
ncbi:MAG TPA: glycosyltransferase family 4 protein [Longimicrobium sp.]|jgi:glycosyltransferase involved in cell wall biosynthesis